MNKILSLSLFIIIFSCKTKDNYTPSLGYGNNHLTISYLEMKDHLDDQFYLHPGIDSVDLDNITELNIYQISFKGFSDEFYKMHHLSKINLYGLDFNTLDNTLIHFPSKFKELDTLNIIDCYSDPDIKSPFEHLLLLEVKDCGLTSLKEWILKQETLYGLTLSKNFIRKIPAKIKDMQNLQTLNLEYNHLKDLPDELETLKNLKELNLNFNAFCEFPSVLFNMPFLKKLHIKGLSLSESEQHEIKIKLPQTDIAF